MHELIQNLLHIDRALDHVLAAYGTTTYALLFLVIFCETGLVITPFLPGDSLLFAAGAIAARGNMNPVAVALLVAAAAFLGDNTNYFVGKFLGPRLLRSESSRLLNRKHLDRTHAFFERHGGKTIILARFVPIVRTFTPFVAGIGAMTYPRFIVYSIAAAALWVGICVPAGYLFGNIPWVKEHFTAVLLAVVFISVIPMLIELLRHRAEQPAAPTDAPND